MRREIVPPSELVGTKTDPPQRGGLLLGGVLIRSPRLLQMTHAVFDMMCTYSIILCAI